jgi:hypothetical protein
MCGKATAQYTPCALCSCVCVCGALCVCPAVLEPEGGCIDEDDSGW